MHSLEATLVMVLIAAVYVAIIESVDMLTPSGVDLGIALPSPGAWPVTPFLGGLINIIITGLVMLMMMLINRSYNVLRALTWLDVGLFALMQAAVPRQVLTLNSGTLACLVILVCVYLMFACFDRRESTRTVFFAFLLLSLGTAVQYCFVFFIPVFWIMLLQLRIFNMRSFVASILGLVTVWILLLGFGIVSVDDLRIPSFVNVFSALPGRAAVYLLVVVSITAFLLVSSIALNVFKTIAYNARARAYNGALTLLAMVTIIAAACDYSNLLSYISMLNMCAAYQITHYFVNHRYDRQYLAVLTVGLIYIILYIWRFTL